ncbi:hypothetical protein LXL04_001913 [Taraxacum kok-saghyz]
MHQNVQRHSLFALLLKALDLDVPNFRANITCNHQSLFAWTSTESGRTEFDVRLGLSSGPSPTQNHKPNAQTKDRVRHLRQNLSLRLFRADRVRRQITDSGPSPTSNAQTSD